MRKIFLCIFSFIFSFLVLNFKYVDAKTINLCQQYTGDYVEESYTSSNNISRGISTYGIVTSFENDIYEDNDTLATATVIPFGSTTNYNNTISASIADKVGPAGEYVNDIDYYRFVIDKENASFSALLSADISTTNVCMYLYNLQDNGYVSVSSGVRSGTKKRLIEYSNMETGSYAIKIYGNNVGFNYSLTFNVVSSSDKIDIGGNSVSNSISAYTRFKKTSYFENDNDVDYVKLNNSTGSENDLLLYIICPNYVQIEMIVYKDGIYENMGMIDYLKRLSYDSNCSYYLKMTTLHACSYTISLNYTFQNDDFEGKTADAFVDFNHLNVIYNDILNDQSNTGIIKDQYSNSIFISDYAESSVYMCTYVLVYYANTIKKDNEVTGYDISYSLFCFYVNVNIDNRVESTYYCSTYIFPVNSSRYVLSNITGNITVLDDDSLIAATNITYVSDLLVNGANARIDEVSHVGDMIDPSVFEPNYSGLFYEVIGFVPVLGDDLSYIGLIKDTAETVYLALNYQDLFVELIQQSTATNNYETSLNDKPDNYSVAMKSSCYLSSAPNVAILRGYDKEMVTKDKSNYSKFMFRFYGATNFNISFGCDFYYVPNDYKIGNGYVESLDVCVDNLHEGF